MIKPLFSLLAACLMTAACSAGDRPVSDLITDCGPSERSVYLFLSIGLLPTASTTSYQLLSKKRFFSLTNLGGTHPSFRKHRRMASSSFAAVSK